MLLLFIQSYHPEPGRLYHGLSTQIYLPNNKLGQHAYAFLLSLFEHNALFELNQACRNISVNRDYMVTFAEGINLKTAKSGGLKKYEIAALKINSILV
jgi:hypothetical protein